MERHFRGCKVERTNYMVNFSKIVIFNSYRYYITIFWCFSIFSFCQLRNRHFFGIAHPLKFYDFTIIYIFLFSTENE